MYRVSFQQGIKMCRIKNNLYYVEYAMNRRVLNDWSMTIIIEWNMPIRLYRTSCVRKTRTRAEVNDISMLLHSYYWYQNNSYEAFSSKDSLFLSRSIFPRNDSQFTSYSLAPFISSSLRTIVFMRGYNTRSTNIV